MQATPPCLVDGYVPVLADFVAQLDFLRARVKKHMVLEYEIGLFAFFLAACDTELRRVVQQFF